MVQAAYPVLGALGSQPGVAAGGVVFERGRELVIDAPGEPDIRVFRELVSPRQTRVHDQTATQAVVVGAEAGIGEDAARRFEIDLEPGARAPGAVGGVELEDLCLGVEDVAPGDAARESVAGVLHFGPQAQDPEATEEAARPKPSV